MADDSDEEEDFTIDYDKPMKTTTQEDDGHSESDDHYHIMEVETNTVIDPVFDKEAKNMPGPSVPNVSRSSRKGAALTKPSYWKLF